MEREQFIPHEDDFMMRVDWGSGFLEINQRYVEHYMSKAQRSLLCSAPTRVITRKRRSSSSK